MFSKSWKKIICTGFPLQAIKNDACKFYGNCPLCPDFETKFMLWCPQNKNLTEKLPSWNCISSIWEVINLWLILTVPAACPFRGSSYFQKARINLCYGKHSRNIFPEQQKGDLGKKTITAEGFTSWQFEKIPRLAPGYNLHVSWAWRSVKYPLLNDRIIDMASHHQCNDIRDNVLCSGPFL